MQRQVIILIYPRSVLRSLITPKGAYIERPNAMLVSSSFALVLPNNTVILFLLIGICREELGRIRWRPCWRSSGREDLVLCSNCFLNRLHPTYSWLNFCQIILCLIGILSNICLFLTARVPFLWTTCVCLLLPGCDEWLHADAPTARVLLLGRETFLDFMVRWRSLLHFCMHTSSKRIGMTRKSKTTSRLSCERNSPRSNCFSACAVVLH